MPFEAKFLNLSADKYKISLVDPANNQIKESIELSETENKKIDCPFDKLTVILTNLTNTEEELTFDLPECELYTIDTDFSKKTTIIKSDKQGRRFEGVSTKAQKYISNPSPSKLKNQYVSSVTQNVSVQSATGVSANTESLTANNTSLNAIRHSLAQSQLTNTSNIPERRETKVKFSDSLEKRVYYTPNAEGTAKFDGYYLNKDQKSGETQQVASTSNYTSGGSYYTSSSYTSAGNSSSSLNTYVSSTTNTQNQALNNYLNSNLNTDKFVNSLIKKDAGASSTTINNSYVSKKEITENKSYVEKSPSSYNYYSAGDNKYVSNSSYNGAASNPSNIVSSGKTYTSSYQTVGSNNVSTANSNLTSSGNKYYGNSTYSSKTYESNKKRCLDLTINTEEQNKNLNNTNAAVNENLTLVSSSNNKYASGNTYTSSQNSYDANKYLPASKNTSDIKVVSSQQPQTKVNSYTDANSAKSEKVSYEYKTTTNNNVSSTISSENGSLNNAYNQAGSKYSSNSKYTSGVGLNNSTYVDISKKNNLSNTAATNFSSSAVTTVTSDSHPKTSFNMQEVTNILSRYNAVGSNTGSVYTSASNYSSSGNTYYKPSEYKNSSNVVDSISLVSSGNTNNTQSTINSTSNVVPSGTDKKTFYSSNSVYKTGADNANIYQTYTPRNQNTAISFDKYTSNTAETLKASESTSNTTYNSSNVYISNAQATPEIVRAGLPSSNATYKSATVYSSNYQPSTETVKAVAPSSNVTYKSPNTYTTNTQASTETVRAVEPLSNATYKSATVYSSNYQPSTETVKAVAPSSNVTYKSPNAYTTNTQATALTSTLVEEKNIPKTIVDFNLDDYMKNIIKDYHSKPDSFVNQEKQNEQKTQEPLVISETKTEVLALPEEDLMPMLVASANTNSNRARVQEPVKQEKVEEKQQPQADSKTEQITETQKEAVQEAKLELKGEIVQEAKQVEKVEDKQESKQEEVKKVESIRDTISEQKQGETQVVENREVRIEAKSEEKQDIVNEIKPEKKQEALQEVKAEEKKETTQNVQNEEKLESQPEKKQESTQEAVQEVVQEAKPEVKQEVVQETKPEVKQEAVQETKPEVKQEVVQETKPEVKQEAVQEAKPEVKQEAVQEAKPEVKQEAVQEAKPEVKQEVVQETKPEVKQEAIQESKPEVKQEVVQETKPEVKQEVVQETKPEVKQEAVQEVKQEVVQEAKPEVKQEAVQKAKPEAKQEVVQEAKPEVKQEVVQEAKPEVKQEAVQEKPEVKQEAVQEKPEVKQEAVQEAKPEVKQEAVQEAKPEVKQEAVQETKPEVKQEAVQETKPEVKQEVVQETKPVVKQEAVQEAKPVVKQEAVQEAKQEVVQEAVQEAKSQQKLEEKVGSQSNLKTTEEKSSQSQTVVENKIPEKVKAPSAENTQEVENVKESKKEETIIVNITESELKPETTVKQETRPAENVQVLIQKETIKEEIINTDKNKNSTPSSEEIKVVDIINQDVESASVTSSQNASPDLSIKKRTTVNFDMKHISLDAVKLEKRGSVVFSENVSRKVSRKSTAEKIKSPEVKPIREGAGAVEEFQLPAAINKKELLDLNFNKINAFYSSMKNFEKTNIGIISKNNRFNKSADLLTSGAKSDISFKNNGSKTLYVRVSAESKEQEELRPLKANESVTFSRLASKIHKLQISLNKTSKQGPVFNVFSGCDYSIDNNLKLTDSLGNQVNLSYSRFVESTEAAAKNNNKFYAFLIQENFDLECYKNLVNEKYICFVNGSSEEVTLRIKADESSDEDLYSVFPSMALLIQRKQEADFLSEIKTNKRIFKYILQSNNIYILDGEYTLVKALNNNEIVDVAEQSSKFSYFNRRNRAETLSEISKKIEKAKDVEDLYFTYEETEFDEENLNEFNIENSSGEDIYVKIELKTEGSDEFFVLKNGSDIWTIREDGLFLVETVRPNLTSKRFIINTSYCYFIDSEFNLRESVSKKLIHSTLERFENSKLVCGKINAHINYNADEKLYGLESENEETDEKLAYFKDVKPKFTRGKRFTDDSFPGRTNSLTAVNPLNKRRLEGNNLHSAEKIDENVLSCVAFKRPEEIFKGNQSVFLFNENNQSEENVYSTYLASIIFCLNQNPSLIRRCFKSQEHSKEGLYEIFYYENGVKKVIFVDDQLPVLTKNPISNTEKVYFSEPKANEIWLPLLEKAYAKYEGGYANTQDGNVLSEIYFFTGALSYKYSTKDSNHKAIWDNLLSNANNSALILSGFDDTEGSKTKENLCQLTYTVLNSYEFDNGDEIIKLVKMRNPGGDFEWLGEYKQNSEKWTPELKKYVDAESAFKDAGVFFLSFEEFIDQFDFFVATYAN